MRSIYRRADDTIRRLINQAIFNALFVCDETITEAEFAEPFAALRVLRDALRGLPASAGPWPNAADVARAAPRTPKAPTPTGAGNLSALVRLAKLWCARVDSNHHGP